MTDNEKEFLEKYHLWIVGMSMTLKEISKEKFIEKTEYFIKLLLECQRSKDANVLQVIADDANALGNSSGVILATMLQQLKHAILINQ